MHTCMEIVLECEFQLIYNPVELWTELKLTELNWNIPCLESAAVLVSGPAAFLPAPPRTYKCGWSRDYSCVYGLFVYWLWPSPILVSLYCSIDLIHRMNEIDCLHVYKLEDNLLVAVKGGLLNWMFNEEVEGVNWSPFLTFKVWHPAFRFYSIGGGNWMIMH